MSTSLSPEEKLAYLITFIHHNTNDVAIDFQAVATERGLTSKHMARRHYKEIVESTKKYDLTTNNKVVLKGEAPATPASGKKRGRPKKEEKAEDTPSKVKKTKKETGSEDIVEEAGDEDEVKAE